MNITYIDGFILLILGLLFTLGFFRGFLGQLISVGALITAYFSSLKIAPALCEWFQNRLGVHESVSIILSFSIILAIIFLFFSFLSHIFKKIILRRFLLKSINSLLGSFIYLSEGILLICILLFSIGIIPLNYRSNIEALIPSIQKSTILKEFYVNNLLFKERHFTSLYLYAKIDQNAVTNTTEDESNENLLTNSPEFKSLTSNSQILELVNNDHLIHFIQNENIKKASIDPIMIRNIKKDLEQSIQSNQDITNQEIT